MKNKHTCKLAENKHICKLAKAKHISRLAAYAMLTLALAQVALVLLSWLITAAMPDSFPRSLLSPEGIRWFFGSFASNLATPWLVGLLLCSIALGALQQSGLLSYDRSIYRQRNAMRLVWVELAAFISVLLLLTLVPHAILLNVMGGFAASSFSRSLLPYLCFMVIVVSLSFGIASERLDSIEAIGEAMSDGIRLTAPLYVLYILVIQLYSSVCYLF